MLKKRKSLNIYMLLALFLVSIVGNMPAATAQGIGSPGLVAFSDVSASDPNAVYIKYVVARGLMSGFPDGSYHPNGALTRAQAAVVLARTAGLNTTAAAGSNFKDVSASHWAAGSITAASQAGYIKGISADTFKPDAKLTRAQGASLFMRLSKQPDSGAALPALNDINNQHWAARAVAMALDAGMVGLSSDKKNFYPDAEFSRGDLSILLAMLISRDPELSRDKLTMTLVVKKGEVKVLTAGASAAETAGSNTAIDQGDSIITGEDGEAELNLPDGSGLLLKANTNLTLKKIQGRNYIKKDGSPGVAIENLEVGLSQGRIFGALNSRHDTKSQLGKIKDKAGNLLASLATHFILAAGDTPWYKTAEMKKAKVKVDMPWGICGIRGSVWSNLVDASQNSSSLLNGEADVTAAGMTQPLAPGQSTVISGSDKAPTPAALMSTDELKAWKSEKSWVEQRNSIIQDNLELTPVSPSAVQAPKPSEVTGSGAFSVSFVYAVWENYVNLGDSSDILVFENIKGIPQQSSLDISKLIIRDVNGKQISLKGNYSFVQNKGQLSIDRDAGTFTVSDSLSSGQYTLKDQDPEEEYAYAGNSDIPAINANHWCLRIKLTSEDTKTLRNLAGDRDGYAFQGSVEATDGWIINTDTKTVASSFKGIKLWSSHMGGMGGM